MESSFFRILPVFYNFVENQKNTKFRFGVVGDGGFGRLPLIEQAMAAILEADFY